MSWAAMLHATTVVFGCGNTLFGDDGLAPKAVAALAAAAPLPEVAFIDAGTSIRPLLLDMSLQKVRARHIILVDVVQEEGRTPGSIRQHRLEKLDGDMPDPAGGFLHHAPTWGLLQSLHDRLGIRTSVLTVQAARIPDTMDDTLSPEAQAALPELTQKIVQLCSL